jgi:ATP-binding cassette subfamily B protein
MFGRGRKRLLVPEVVQTSAMDCGPAALKALLEGFGIPVSYGRLREACQTDVDGTSIDTLEEVARQLGLEAEQVMLPVDHLLLSEAQALPALLVVRQPSGMTHFVVAWRRMGPLVQVMDPGVGRRWLRRGPLLRDVFVHEQSVPAAAWHAWARSDEFQRLLFRRLGLLGLGRDSEGLIEQAAQAPSWQGLARLDAATRLVTALVGGGGIRPGAEAGRLLRRFLEAEAGTPDIPDPYWSVRAAEPLPDGEEQVRVRGAVLVRITGRSAAPAQGSEALGPRSPELAAALAEPGRAAGLVAPLLRGGSWRLPGLAVCLALAAGGTVLEALLLRGVFDLGRSLGLVEQRLQAVGCFLLFGSALLAVELLVAGGLARLGRRLEVSLRAAFLERLPRLHDRYLHSRPISDMAERCHALHQLRLLPRLVGQFGRSVLTLLLTVAAVAWIDPPSAGWVVAGAALAVALPLAALPVLQGLDLRLRTHAGALGRFYLDALLGLTAIRAHGAERSVCREHEALLVEWAHAARRLLHWLVALQAVQILTGFALAVWLLHQHVGRVGEAGAALLLAYWVLNLPALGEEVAQLVWQYPTHRNRALRLLEPLGAPEEAPPGIERPAQNTPGVALGFEGVSVRAAGHTILAGVDLHIAPGSQVAVVGASGAGKSSLVGLLLGWHRAAEGRVLVDGEVLDAARLERLREETAWVDPSAQLWNAPLVDNLLYGLGPEGAAGLGEVLADADLVDVLQRLPEGLQTTLGEGGGRLSGGQGQRVRLGRALGRRHARLVLLDEAFRGLERSSRQALLEQARRVWQGATLLCVTHDVAATRDFPRVLVLHDGRVVEDGPPALLLEQPHSRYRALLEAEEAAGREMWADPRWQRLRLEAGQVVPCQYSENRLPRWCRGKGGENGVLHHNGVGPAS